MLEQPETPTTQPNRQTEDFLSTRNPSVDWAERGAFPKRLLNALERFSLAFEKPLSRLVRQQKFNPLYHTGTITVFLLFIILATGIYLTMFYQFGFEASYEAVTNIEANFVGRAMRALHRYASGAAVIFALLHGWRTFFQDRFRGPRGLAWISGIGMAVLVWLIGITGYWLIWDQRAGVLNQTLINLLNETPIGTAFLVDYLVSEIAGTGWVFLVLIISLHLGLSAFVGVFFWLHIKRLSRAKWLPPRYWMAAIGGLLVTASILVPVGMLAPIDPASLPEVISADFFYLFYLPAGLYWRPVILWGGVILLTTLTSAIPWLFVRKKRPPVEVDPERCTGCTLCAADCPYKAIEMIERQDGKIHKYLAVIDPKMCVACGICIGTCEPLAMSLSGKPAGGLWQETLAQVKEQGNPIRVIFTCERHASQNLTKIASLHKVEEQLVQIVPLTCIGMAHPNLATQALEAGASEVQFIGCPPEDCANREGNLWMQERLDRTRLPRLDSRFKAAAIYTDWLAPHDFSPALHKPDQEQEASTYKLDYAQINWRNFIPAIFLLIIVLAIQIWLSDMHYHPYPAQSALLEIVLDHKAGYPLQESTSNLKPELGLVYPTELILEVDGKSEFRQTYPPYGKGERATAFEQIRLEPGEHHLRLSMIDRPKQGNGENLPAQILYDELVFFKNHGILRLSYSDASLGSDPLAGRKLFFESSLGASASCHVCHSLEPAENKVGPSLAGVASRAAARVPDLEAEAYLREAIINPDAYLVEGYPAGLMLPDLEEKLSETQIEDLVAFLLTLK